MIRLKDLIFENKLEKLQYPVIKKSGYYIIGNHDPNVFQIGKYYSDGDVLNYIQGQHNNFEDDDRVSGIFICLELNPNDIPESEWDISDDKVNILSKSIKAFPPIVIDKKMNIIDGGHRLLASIKRGDKKIKVLKQI